MPGQRGHRAQTRTAQHRPNLPGPVLLTAALLWGLAVSLGSEPPAGDPLLPGQWGHIAVIAVVILAILLTATAVYVVWRYPRSRVLRPLTPLPRRSRGGQARDRDWRAIVLFLLYFAAITVLFVWINRFFGPREMAIENGDDKLDEGEPLETLPPAPDGPDISPFLLTSLLILVVLLTVGAILSMRGRRSRQTTTFTLERPAQHRHAADLADAAERALDAISKPAHDPRAAIIACYAEMEEALTEADEPAPLESDTPSEVLARAVALGYVTRGPAEELVGLFAEARYSSHTMTAGQQRTAAELLRSLLDDVRRAPSAPLL
ncbi:DUF4129 domain-containing protein [Hoyosella subflava]|uniref:Protein-glutamine gamma-glutamyltransferase-like C-terminal domain-containing protein n=1 Tax=Hoyosella subflava (strain DSM 45089 / JCM 17490 / NBRC 109087 / DQS3-9A1) TaxID=443218 RepID=F6EKH5_HOYSD|nr:DUF4129 domain-containing protein [Hoyosella subflava]AEF39146.1 hypothetical protein AS9A_0692 [Hoyosella subflava DQS3-9A1]